MKCAYLWFHIFGKNNRYIYTHQRKRRKIIPVNLKANVFSSVYKIGKKSPTFAKDKLITFWLNLDEKLAKVCLPLPNRSKFECGIISPLYNLRMIRFLYSQFRLSML
jgi:hypothetical protein